MIAGVSKSLSSFCSSGASDDEDTHSSDIALQIYHAPVEDLLVQVDGVQSFEIAPPLVHTDLIIVSCTCSGNHVAIIETFTSPS